MASPQRAAANLTPFLPAKTWEGSKPGYYFGTTKEKGTGYHLDDYQLKKSNILAGSKHKLVSTVDRPSAKRAKRKGVVFNDDKNETRTIPSNAEAAALLEQAEEAAKDTKVLELSPKGVQLGLQNLKKAQEKNQIMRAQHPDDPEQYMDSELALYEAITALQPIAADPLNLYPPLLMLESSQNSNTTKRLYDSPEMLWTTTFTQLCMHDNSDVVSSVVALLLELLDPSLLNTEQPNQHASNKSILLLGQAILEYLMELLVANLARLQPQASTNSTENSSGGIGKGVEDVLSLMENLLELDLLAQNNDEIDDDDDDDNSNKKIALVANGGSVAAKIVQDTPFLSWLFVQIQNGTASKDRSLELLAFLVQREEVHKIHPDWTKLAPFQSVFDTDDDDGGKQKDKKDDPTMDGMEILLLHGIAPFRKKQPANETEVEALENACIAVEAALTFSPQNVQTFLDAQGIELVLRCLKEKVHAGGVGLKLLDFAGSGDHPVYKKACEHLVAEAGGLKLLFPLYMGRQTPKTAAMSWAAKNDNGNKKKPNHALQKAKKEWLHTIESHTIRIIFALTRHLTDESPCDAKQRLLVKFLDQDKSDRLVELLLAYDQKARMAEFKFWKSDVEDELNAEGDAIQLAALEAKLRGGGDIFQRLGAIAGFCCVGSKRCHEKILSQLSLQQSGIAVIKAALEEFVSVLGTGKQAEQMQTYFDAI